MMRIVYGTTSALFTLVILAFFASPASAGEDCQPHCNEFPANQNTCPPARPYYIIDFCSYDPYQSDACCDSDTPNDCASYPECGTITGPCDQNDWFQCPGTASEYDVRSESGVDTCLRLVPEECPDCCPVENECGGGCTATTTCNYQIWLGPSGLEACGADGACALECSHDKKIYFKNCLCPTGQGCLQVEDSHIGCGNAF